jgi:hypothetical protein
MKKVNPWQVTGYKRGQNVSCKVDYAEKDGYAVTIIKDKLPGFIKTSNSLKSGDEVLGVFVCVHQGRILLDPQFSDLRTTAHQLKSNTVNWQDHIDNPDALDEQYEMQAQTSRNRRLGDSEAAEILAQAQAQQNSQQAAQVDDGQSNYDQNNYDQNNYDQNNYGQAAQQAQPADADLYDPNFGSSQGNGQNGGSQSYQSAFEATGEVAPPAGANQSPYQSPDQAWAAQFAAPDSTSAQTSSAPPLPDPMQNPWASPQQAQYDQYAPDQPANQVNLVSGGSASVDFQAPAVVPPQGQGQLTPAGAGTGGGEEQWQSPHSQVPTKRFRLRRAIDLVMPPVDQDGLEGLKSFKIADYDMEWLITDLEGGMRTGCIKATSEQRLSRSAALLYRGRAVGCIYGCKASPEAKPTEESLSAMLTDLDAPDAVVTLYDLPEDVTIAMAALFLGYPIDNNPAMSAREYSDFIMSWFAENGSTACLAVTIGQTKSTYLVFVHKGKFAGVFFVEEQAFSRDATEILKLFNQYPDANIEASLLNAETLTSGVRFGYSLTMARKKGIGI